MRVVFVNRFYWPETPATGQLLTDLAEFFAKKGHEVVVISSHSGNRELPSTERRNGVGIHRIRGTRFFRGGLFGKAVDWGTFYLGALWALFHLARRNDVIVALTDPPFIGIGAWGVAGLRGARLIHWAQDIYPELAIELAGQQWLRLLRPLRNAAWRTADACVTLGSDMASVLETASVDAKRSVIIPNWAPAGLLPPSAEEVSGLRKAWGLAGKFVVGYSGNLGRVHDLEPVLAVADALRNEQTIVFVFIGDGAQRQALQAETARRGLANVSFLPAQRRDALPASLGAVDLHLVTLRPGCEHLVFPSKVYGIAAAGRPMLFIGPRDCELAAIIRAYGCGETAERDEITRMAENIRRLAHDSSWLLAQANAAARFARVHDFSVAAAHWEQLLQRMNTCRPGTLAARTLAAQ